MATYSSILAQKIPWTEGPGGLQSGRSPERETTYRLNNNNLGQSIVIIIRIT